MLRQSRKPNQASWGKEDEEDGGLDQGLGIAGRRPETHSQGGGGVRNAGEQRCRPGPLTRAMQVSFPGHPSILCLGPLAHLTLGPVLHGGEKGREVRSRPS